MTNKTGQQPLILLISKEEREDSFLKEWLEENQSLICEATNIFQVIEGINDFTVRECPGVFLMEVESASQDSVEKMFYISYGSTEIEVLTFAKTVAGKNRKSATVSQLKAKFNEVLPTLSRAA